MAHSALWLEKPFSSSSWHWRHLWPLWHPFPGQNPLLPPQGMPRWREPLEMQHLRRANLQRVWLQLSPTQQQTSVIISGCVNPSFRHTHHRFLLTRVVFRLTESESLFLFKRLDVDQALACFLDEMWRLVEHLKPQTVNVTILPISYQTVQYSLINSIKCGTILKKAYNLANYWLFPVKTLRNR